jgi:tetratricopeptide (TPR) repeat protein
MPFARRWVAPLLLLSGALAACDRRPAAGDKLNMAQLLLVRGDAETALALFDEAIGELEADHAARAATASPGNDGTSPWAEAHLGAAEALICLDRPEEGLARFETIDAREPAAREKQRDRRTAIRKRAVEKFDERRRSELRHLLPEVERERSLR